MTRGSVSCFSPVISVVARMESKQCFFRCGEKRVCTAFSEVDHVLRLSDRFCKIMRNIVLLESDVTAHFVCSIVFLAGMISSEKCLVIVAVFSNLSFCTQSTSCNVREQIAQGTDRGVVSIGWRRIYEGAHSFDGTLCGTREAQHPATQLQSHLANSRRVDVVDVRPSGAVWLH